MKLLNLIGPGKECLFRGREPPPFQEKSTIGKLSYLNFFKKILIKIGGFLLLQVPIET